MYSVAFYTKFILFPKKWGEKRHKEADYTFGNSKFMKGQKRLGAIQIGLV